MIDPEVVFHMVMVISVFGCFMHFMHVPKLNNCKHSD